MKSLSKYAALLLVFVICGCSSSANAEEQRFAYLGDFRLESGETIKDCRIGYRTRGALNPQRSNAVLVLTWLTGTTEELEQLGYIGAGKMIDTSKYYVIAVDALGNGVSSSPSNSSKQPYDAFPLFTIGDMVSTQHELLMKHLGISHVYAIAGISMGGMQAFKWIVEHPLFMDRVVAICSSPWMTSADLLGFNAELAVIDAGQKCGSSNGDIIKSLTPLHATMTWAPAFRAANTKPEDIDAFISETEKLLLKYNAYNWEWQLRAIKMHNILKAFGGSAVKAAEAVKAAALVITSAQDYCVYQGPSKSFSPLINANTFELTGDCGHFSFICEQDKLSVAVNDFLSAARDTAKGNSVK